MTPNQTLLLALLLVLTTSVWLYLSLSKQLRRAEERIDRQRQQSNELRRLVLAWLGDRDGMRGELNKVTVAVRKLERKPGEPDVVHLSMVHPDAAHPLCIVTGCDEFTLAGDEYCHVHAVELSHLNKGKGAS